MTELDNLFETNVLPENRTPEMQIFWRLFDHVDYIGHQAENKNGVLWLFRDSVTEKVEISGVTDTKGNYVYVRYRNPQKSFSIPQADKIGATTKIEARLVGILKDRRDFQKIVDFVVHIMLMADNIEILDGNTNTLQVYREEVGNENELTKNLGLFCVDFDFLHIIEKCDFENIINDC